MGGLPRGTRRTCCRNRCRLSVNQVLLLALPVFATPLVTDAAPTITQPAATAGTPIELPALKESDVNLVLDGKLDESFWQTVPGYDRMTIIEPDKLTAPNYRTELRYFYTDKAFYVGLIAEQPPETLRWRIV